MSHRSNLRCRVLPYLTAMLTPLLHISSVRWPSKAVLLCFVATFGLTAYRAVAGDALLHCDDIASHFVLPQQSSTLRWSYQGDELADAAREFIVRDYQGGTVVKGRATPAGDRGIKVDVKLPRGFYDIEFPATKQRFGIVALPPAPGQTDPFFCIDGALSWLVPNTPLRGQLVTALQRCGIAMVRERLNWTDIEPQAKQWNWQGDPKTRGYETLRKQLLEHHIPALEVFHNAPAWTNYVEKYPDDLVATAQSWTEIMKHWDASCGALEVWNEPDIFFGGNLPADQYLAVLKTLAWSRDQAQMKAKLVGGVVAHFDPDFQKTAVRNGMLDLVDVASFHTYGRADALQSLVERFRVWTTEFSHTGKPLWLTECGRPWKRGPGRPPMVEDQVSALDITMKAVEARAAGVQRYFAFVYPYYEERDNNFGMMGRAGTPLRAMSAYANCAARLAHAQFVGNLVRTDQRLQRTRVFRADRETIVVLYTGRADSECVIDLGVPAEYAEGIDGRRLPLTDKSKIPVADGLTYVVVKWDHLADKVQSDTVAGRLLKAAHSEPRKPIPASPIVVRFQFDRAQLDAKTSSYQLRSKLTGPLTLTFRVFNLGDKAQTVELPLRCVESLHAVSGKKERTLAIAPHTYMDATWQVDLTDVLTRHLHASLFIRPQSTTGGKITPTVITIHR